MAISHFRMRHRVRSYLALALTCLLVFTGQAMAVARGMPLPVDQIVICSGSGPVMIRHGTDWAHDCSNASDRRMEGAQLGRSTLGIECFEFERNARLTRRCQLAPNLSRQQLIQHFDWGQLQLHASIFHSHRECPDAVVFVLQ